MQRTGTITVWCLAGVAMLGMAACSTPRETNRATARATTVAAAVPVEVAAPATPVATPQPPPPPAQQFVTQPEQPAWMNSLHLARQQRPAPRLEPPPAPAPSSDKPSLYATSAILIDAHTGKTLFEKNPDERRAVASTQKLLTALLVAERGGLDSYVTTAASDTRVEPTKLGFGPGERYTRRSLLNAMMVKSCNDAAEALARDYAGSSAAFAAAMNAKARQLGAYNSHFVNAHGLTEPGQYSTARDIAKIAYAAYRNPTLRQMMKMPSYTFRFNNGRVATLKATNSLLTRSDVFNGMKTGYTQASGRCLVSSMSRGGRDLILVQLGSRTKYIFDDAARVMQWGYENAREAYAQHDASAATHVALP